MKSEDFIITLDVDWAPDFVIEDVAAKLTEHRVKATWFITHDSPAIRALKLNPDFEIGLHPNFLPGSSQGATTEEVLKFLFDIAPDAVSVRSHAVVQSGPLLNHYAKHTPLRIDSTIFLPEMPQIRPVKHLLPDGFLWRVPFFWADDFEMCKRPPQWNFAQYPPVPGLKVMMFHPVHVYYNTPGIRTYGELRTQHDLLHLPEAGALKLRCEGAGARTFFADLVNFAAGRVSYRLKDLPALYPGV